MNCHCLTFKYSLYNPMNIMGITNHTEWQVSTFRNGLHEKCGDEGMKILNFGIIK
jgi:hypothetical protein